MIGVGLLLAQVFWRGDVDEGAARARRAMVDQVMQAVAARSDDRLKRLGAWGAPYFFGYELPSYSKDMRGRISRPFSSTMLAEYATCKAGLATGGIGAWVTIEWSCPTEAQAPYLQTAFRFADQRITEIRTVPVAMARRS